ncbi:GntR family transcriptional regulator [Streptomyces sp. NPDC003374]
MTKKRTNDSRGENSPYEKIKQGILDGTFAPGSALVESALAEWCGVSRTPVREALSRLERDGVVNKTDRGMAVRERTPEEILDIYEVRIALEVTAARLAAVRHTRIDQIRLERLMTLLTETSDDAPGDVLAERNREFHRGIWAASHNQTLIDLLDRINLHLLRYPVTTLTTPGRWQQSLREHRELVTAVIARDEARAQKIAGEHFSAARDIRLKLWEQSIV